jgi:sulfate transport system permease protein
VSAARARATLPVAFLLLVLLPLVLMPLGAVYAFALRGGVGAFIEALAAREAQFALRFSLLVAFAATACNVVVGTLAAYVLARHRFPGRHALGVVVNLPIAIPTVVVGTSLLLLWGPIGLLGQWLDPLGVQPMFRPAGVVLAHVFVTLPYVIGAVRPVLDQLETSYEEAAFTMGASRWQTFRFVLLPAIRGAVFSGALLSFAHSLGEFGATVMVSGNLAFRTQTAPLYIFAQFESGNLAQANAVAAVLATLSFVIFLVLLRSADRSAGR